MTSKNVWQKGEIITRLFALHLVAASRISALDYTTPYMKNAYMDFDLQDPSDGQFFDKHADFFRLHNFSEEEQHQAGPPFIWEGIRTLADALFSGKIFYWASPLFVSAFLLKTQDTILIGETYGPSYDELIQLLSGLQVVNNQHDLLNQYESERKSFWYELIVYMNE